ncbi:MAG TPA: hypothetical protein DCL38_06870 [Lachnospiraceae bacterium]|nr:hypothetical protein [Lachnospiraceae bacterium]
MGVSKASRVMAGRIPYEFVYEEAGLFEVREGVFSRAFLLKEMRHEVGAGVSGGLAVKRYASLLNRLPQDMTVQFMVYNRLIPLEDFLKDILVVPDKGDALNVWIDRYNRMLAEYCDVGHNNVKKLVYLILSVKRDTPEEAVRYFKKQEDGLRKLFEERCGLEAVPLSAGERLRVMYSVLNPGKEDFGRRLGYAEGENPALTELKERRLTTKDCIAPSMIDLKYKDHLVLNQNTYVRSFLITSLPVSLSNSLINDITNISSNMIFSCIYEPADARYGLEASARAVAENVVVKESAKRDTISERRERAVVRREMMLTENEEKFGEKAALKTFRNAVAAEDRTFLCTFVIVIFAEDLQVLNRDSELLHISTSKFACQVKCLDLQQLEGLQTVLPLCTCFVDAKRMFSLSRLAAIPPFGFNSAFGRGGTFIGLNAINDNLVLHNRKSGKNPAGLIAGVEHSGKTFQCRREIFNALISTEDKVIILSDSAEYEGFVKRLGGEVRAIMGINPFEMREHYGLVNTDIYSKTIMIEALLAAAVKECGEISGGLSVNEGEEITNEAEVLLKYAVELRDAEAVREAVLNNADQLPVMAETVRVLEQYLQEGSVSGGGRFILYRFGGLMELILLMDHLFNRMIEDSENNITIWLFIDSVDILLSLDQTAAFLSDYIEKMNALQNVFTGVVQSSVRLFTDKAAAFRLEDLTRQVGYHKLLNQGAIERMRYTELLNISNSLVNHLTGAELGRGVVFTPFSNVAFDDNFGDEKDGAATGLYELFSEQG